MIEISFCLKFDEAKMMHHEKMVRVELNGHTRLAVGGWRLILKYTPAKNNTSGTFLNGTEKEKEKET